MCTTDGQAHAGTTEAGTDPTGTGPAGWVPADAAQALACARAGLAYLAAADPASLTGAEQADLLRGLAAAESQHLAARSAVLAGFDRAGGYADDAAASAKSWLRLAGPGQPRGGRRGDGVGAAAAASPPDRRGAGCRAGIAVVGAAPRRLDRPAARGRPRRGRQDPAGRRRRRRGPGGPGRPGRADLRRRLPGPTPTPAGRVTGSASGGCG